MKVSYIQSKSSLFTCPSNPVVAPCISVYHTKNITKYSTYQIEIHNKLNLTVIESDRAKQYDDHVKSLSLNAGGRKLVEQ